MATQDSIMAGLFQNPEQYQQALQAQALNEGIKMAQLSPVERAEAGGYAAAAGIGRGIAGLMGVEDPQMKIAATRQSILQQVDQTDPQSLAQAAQALNQAGDVQGARAMAQAAQEAAFKQSQITKNLREGNAAMLTTDQRNFAQAQKDGYKGSFNQWLIQQKKAGATNVNVDNKQETAFASGLGAAQAKGVMDSKAAAEDAASILETNEVGRQLLSSGAITGTGANFFVGLNSALKQAGIDFGYGDAAANTQAYAAAMGSNVGKLIKQFGAGTGLSDADRKYATQIAAGDISIDEKAIRRILDINDRASKNIISKHNKRVEGIKTNVPLTVELPTSTSAKPVTPAAQIPTTGGATGNPLIDKYLVKPQGQ
jgi:hypothetical protein